MVNVRFYRLETLPNFDVSKQGIFVHVTKPMKNEIWTLSDGSTKFDPATLWMEPEKKVGESVERINLVKWLSTRHITEIASGLWFGGENGWELLTNDTSSGAITAAIDALNAGGFTQATIGANPEGSESATDSILTIKGIKEVKGKIDQDDTKNFVVAIDGVYNESTNKIATESTVTTAIGTLDSEGTIQAVTTAPAQGNTDNTVLTFKGIKEENGKILQGDGASTFTVGDAKLKIQIGSNEAGALEVFSANAQSNGAIKLNEYVFKKDGDVISVITPTAVSESNKLVTQQDIANLNGAMHYKGALTGAQNGDGSWPQTVKAGDVYIVTTGFTHSNESNPFEVGDMIVFNSTSALDYKVIQSNLTLGTGDGQIAKNVGILSTNNNVVVATSEGIKTIEITETQLTGADNNKRDLSIANGNIEDGGFHHAVTITDTFKVIGKDFSKSINITSNNRSIDIANNGNIGVMVDLVWNTTIE